MNNTLLGGSQRLMIADNDTYSAGCVLFGPPNGQEFRHGEVAFSVDLWFESPSEGAAFDIGVRESGSAAHSFLDLGFSDEGNVRLYGQMSRPNRVIARYDDRVGRALPLDLVFDLDRGTFEVWLDGDLLAEDVPHGVTERGIGSIFLGVRHDPDLEGRFYIDNVVMTHDPGSTAPN